MAAHLSMPATSVSGAQHMPIIGCLHLHDEIAIDGKNVNPANDEFSLIDPQCIIYGFDGAVLPPLPIVKVELIK